MLSRKDGFIQKLYDSRYAQRIGATPHAPSTRCIRAMVSSFSKYLPCSVGQLATMEDVASVLEKGKLTPEIAVTFSLQDASAAYAAYAGKGTVGKIVVLP